MRSTSLSQSLLPIAAVLFCAPLAAQQQTVHCSAREQPRNFCPADTHNGVLLVRDDSRGTCQQGSTWEIRPDGIRVSNGCSADFLVNSGNAYQSAPQNGYNGQDNRPNGGNGRDDHRDDHHDDGDRNRPRPIFAGTDFDVRVEQAISPGNAQQGQTIPGRLVTDLVVRDHVLAPQGTAVLLRVVSPQGSQLDLRLDSIALGPVTYSLQTTGVHGLRDSVGGETAGDGRGLGGFLNSIDGGPQIPRGTEFHFQLTSQAEPVFAPR